MKYFKRSGKVNLKCVKYFKVWRLFQSVTVQWKVSTIFLEISILWYTPE